jgi:hypothetical protein
MRRLVLGLLVALGISAFGAEARAQLFGGVNDPALAYYALYLPRQQAQAMNPGPEATLNAVSANRQAYAATGRNSAFDPDSSGLDSLDFGFDYNPNGKARKRPVLANSGKFGVHGGNLNGLGPQGYYQSQALNKYYRELRSGRGRNANVSVTRGGRGMSSGGYGGVGGLPGPR